MVYFDNVKCTAELIEEGKIVKLGNKAGFSKCPGNQPSSSMYPGNGPTPPCVLGMSLVPPCVLGMRLYI